MDALTWKAPYLLVLKSDFYWLAKVTLNCDLSFFKFNGVFLFHFFFFFFFFFFWSCLIFVGLAYVISTRTDSRQRKAWQLGEKFTASLDDELNYFNHRHINYGELLYYFFEQQQKDIVKLGEVSNRKKSKDQKKYETIFSIKYISEIYNLYICVFVNKSIYTKIYMWTRTKQKGKL